MTPRQRAKEIYDKMKGFRVKNTHRKKCALICVDEILNQAQMIETPYEGFSNPYQFYLRVKKEIENL